MEYQSTKVIELGSAAFRQWRATHSHCRFLHGYQLKAKLWFGGSSLDEKNWIVDFGGLKELKAKLQYLFDHTTTVAADDPELETFKELDRKGIIQLRVFDKGVGIERVAEKVFEVSNEYIKSLTAGRCWVDKVEVFEHEDNSATFTKVLDAPQQILINEVSAYTTKPVSAFVETTEQTPVEQPAAPEINPRAANVGSNVSQGKSNWFSGTSWG